MPSRLNVHIENNYSTKTNKKRETLTPPPIAQACITRSQFRKSLGMSGR